MGIVCLLKKFLLYLTVSTAWLLISLMIIEALALWVTFTSMLGVIHDILKLLVYSVLGCCILMWWVITTLFSLIYNCVYTTFTGVGSLANNIVLTVYHPLQAGGTTLYQFFSLGFNVLTLALHLVYYTIALWLFCYVIILLHRFIQRHDFAIQGGFYFGPSPRCNHFGGQGQPLTIAPILLDHHRQRVPAKHNSLIVC